MEKAVLTGQGERPGAGPAAAPGAAAAADSPAVSAAADPAVTAAADPAVTASADPAAVSAAADPAVAPAADPAEAPARARVPRWVNLPYAIVLATAAGGLAGVALGGLHHVQAGMLTVASALLAAAVLRLVLPERAAGLLVSRRRVFDILALAGLGAGIMAAVLVLPTP